MPVHQGRTVPVGTLRDSPRDADVSVDEFHELLLMMALTNGLVLRAFRLTLPPFAAVLSLVIVMSGIPASRLPGRPGILTYLCQLALSLFGIGPATGLPYGLVLQLVVYLPLLGVRAICLLRESWLAGRYPPASHWAS